MEQVGGGRMHEGRFEKVSNTGLLVFVGLLLG